jgi:PTS system nitrogen regulatory IIA component
LGWTPLDIYGDNANIAYPRWIAAVPKEDFDIDSLAVYLHLTPQQVMRLADRGKVPGRKVAGQWRFSQAEIHHWLEDRIGLSDEVELAEMETVLERSHAAEDSVSISQLLHRDAIAIPLEARTRNSVINAMTRLAAGTGLLWDPEKMAEAVSERENLHPTALDNGVALLHPRRPMESILAEPLLALGCTSSGIPFGAERYLLFDLFHRRPRTPSCAGPTESAGGGRRDVGSDSDGDYPGGSFGRDRRGGKATAIVSRISDLRTLNSSLQHSDSILGDSAFTIQF